MAEPRALIALLLLAIVVLHFFVGERARKHAFSRDPPPRPAARWRLRQALVGDEEEVLLELVCARDGRSLYCAGDDARCVADDTVPLFRRAFARTPSGGRGDVALTQTDEAGRRVRLEARDGRVVCAPALGDDDAEQAAAGAAWRSGQHKRAKFPTSKAPISAIFHSFWLIFGRAIISRNGLEAWMLFPERARAEHSR